MRPLLVFLLLLVTPAWAQSGLSPAHLAKLKQFGPKIVVAGYIPPGAKLVKVDVEIDKRFGNSYFIRYKGPGKAEFTVQAANGGIGDGPDGDPYPFNSPVMGKGTLYLDNSQKTVWSGWLSLPGQQFPVFALAGSNLDPATAVKIVESFRLQK